MRTKEYIRHIKYFTEVNKIVLTDNILVCNDELTITTNNREIDLSTASATHYDNGEEIGVLCNFNINANIISLKKEKEKKYIKMNMHLVISNKINKSTKNIFVNPENLEIQDLTFNQNIDKETKQFIKNHLELEKLKRLIKVYGNIVEIE